MPDYTITITGSADRALQRLVQRNQNGLSAEQLLRAVVLDRLQEEIGTERNTLAEDVRAAFDRLDDNEIGRIRRIVSGPPGQSKGEGT